MKIKNRLKSESCGKRRPIIEKYGLLPFLPHYLEVDSQQTEIMARVSILLIQRER